MSHWIVGVRRQSREWKVVGITRQLAGIIFDSRSPNDVDSLSEIVGRSTEQLGIDGFVLSEIRRISIGGSSELARPMSDGIECPTEFMLLSKDCLI